MKDLDFSGISTEKLEYAVENYSNDSPACEGIDCQDDKCPYLGTCRGHQADRDIRHQAFKAELKRREKDMNTMPELKAGMIVEVEGVLYILLPDTGDGIDGFGLFNAKGKEYQMTPNKEVISKIYMKHRGCNYGVFFNKESLDIYSTGNLVWSKQSPNDIKKAELLSTIEDLKKQVEDLND